MLGSKIRTRSRCADELQAAMSGRVALPGYELYDEGCRVWNSAIRHRPVMVAHDQHKHAVSAALVRAGDHRRQRRGLQARRAHGAVSPTGTY